MTNQEALKLALEALEDIKDDCSGCEFEWSNDYPLQAKAKLALEKALAKQEHEYPFGVYSTEDLNNAWKSGYDNCKAQAVWTLEDVKNAWKRGYASAKKECRAKEAKEKP